MSESTGSLVVVGIGIEISQTTIGAISHIEKADEVYYLVSSPIAKSWLENLNPNTFSLHLHYAEDKDRMESYNEMVEVVLAAVRKGKNVCAVFYGHPGVFANPPHRMIKVAKKEGYSAKMLPGVSAEDCLFADLGIDPGQSGCQSFEATDFVVHDRKFDPNVPLILWQIGLIGDITFKLKYDQSKVNILKDKLMHFYPPNHNVIVYEASTLSMFSMRNEHLPLTSLGDTNLSATSTLYVPKFGSPTVHVDIINTLGFSLKK
jgi:uncharacterized protein YabN with tetrapyrrole methylase and pyrophosphatase domain